MTFAEKLREKRKEAGLSQTELAAACGISMRTLQNYESGKRYPANLEIAGRLAATLGTRTDLLLSAGEESIVVAPGRDAKRQLEELVGAVSGLFAGGELTEEDRDAAMEAMIDAYWAAKKESRKYARKEGRK